MPDPLTACNAHVREFSEAHRIHRTIREDGEVVLLLGPKITDSHCSYMHPTRNVWTAFIESTYRGQKIHVRRLLEAGAVDAWMTDDPLVIAEIHEDRLIEVLSKSTIYKPRRKKRISEEERQRLADIGRAHQFGDGHGCAGPIEHDPPAISPSGDPGVVCDLCGGETTPETTRDSDEPEPPAEAAA